LGRKWGGRKIEGVRGGEEGSERQRGGSGGGRGEERKRWGRERGMGAGGTVEIRLSNEGGCGGREGGGRRCEGEDGR